MTVVVPVWPVRVSTEGRLQIAGTHRARFLTWIRTLADVDCDLIVRRRVSRRSAQQNRWLWGIAYPIIAEALGYEAHELEDVHYGLVAKWGGEHFDKRIGTMIPNRRSSRLSIAECSAYMEWLVRYGAMECGGVQVPMPNEVDLVEYDR